MRLGRGWAIAFCFFGLIGLADATFLTAQKITGGILPCSSAQPCEVVTNSSYAMVGPIPLAAFGVAYYLVIVIFGLVAFDSKQETWLRRLSVISWVGFLASAYFVYLQAFVIHAFCVYCLVSAGVSTLIWIMGLALQFQRRRADPYGQLPHIQ